MDGRGHETLCGGIGLLCLHVQRMEVGGGHLLGHGRLGLGHPPLHAAAGPEDGIAF